MRNLFLENMKKPVKHADLHMHTTASDGTDTLEERIKDAEDKELNAIAITDHDTINEELKDRVFTAENGVEVITGAEIKCEVQGSKIEILAYFIDPEEKNIQQLFEELSKKREERMEKFVENLNEAHGLGLKLEEILAKAEGNVGRPHLAEVLVDKEIVNSSQEAFDMFIGEEHDEYVEVDKISAGEVIGAVHRNGAVASLAHPGRSLSRKEVDRKVSTLVDKGIDAVEVKYTYEDKREKNSYDVNFGREKASKLAEKFNLLKTGGSDCHGSGSDKYLLGGVKIPYSWIEALKDLADKD